MGDITHGRVRILDDERLGVTIHGAEQVMSPKEWRGIAERILDAVHSDAYGCHCDLESMEDGFEPDGCVIDEGNPQDCIYANCGDKWKCKYWRPKARRHTAEAAHG